MSETLKRAAELLREGIKMRELINAVALSRDEYEAAVARIEELCVLVADIERMAQAEPVAWLVERHAFRVSQHGQDADGNDWLEVTNDGEAEAFPVYPAPPLPRDVLMAVALDVYEEVRIEVDRWFCGFAEPDDLMASVEAIADRHAAHAAANPDSAQPVNQQLLEVANSILAPDIIDLLPAEYVARVKYAIAAAASAQAQEGGA